MRLNEQTKFGGKRGNCLAACVSSLLDLPIEDVPNVETLFDLELDGSTIQDYEYPPLWAQVLDAFIKSKGYVWREATDQEWQDTTKDHLFLVIGKGLDQITNHACIYRNNTLLHDPNPHRKGLSKILSVQVIEPIR